jgi:ABC-type nitrate/sulfonate/bicarbonate transport system permease component
VNSGLVNRVASPAIRQRVVGQPAARQAVVRLAIQIAVIAAALAVWQLWTGAAKDPYFPEPSTIISALRHQWFTGPASHLWLNGDGTGNLLPSLGRMLGGWAAASLIGIVAGVAIGRLPVLADLSEPVVHFARAVPPAILVPVFLVMFPVGTPVELATIVFGVLWPVLLNSIDGARQVHQGHIESARAFQVPAFQRLVRIILPSAAPKIFAGLRVALALALTMMIISEFAGSIDGIGREENEAWTTFDVPVIWAVIILLGLLGIVFNAVFSALEHRILAWQRGARSTS